MREGRRHDDLRPIEVTVDYLEQPMGAVLWAEGKTKVLCTASLDEGVPRWLRDSGRARYVAVSDEQALEAFALTTRLEGIIPALESAHALAWTLSADPSELDLVCLSGRGDKDLEEALDRLGRRHGR